MQLSAFGDEFVLQFRGNLWRCKELCYAFAKKYIECKIEISEKMIMELCEPLMLRSCNIISYNKIVTVRPNAIYNFSAEFG